MSNGYQFFFLVIYWIVIFANSHDVLAETPIISIPNQLVKAEKGEDVTLVCDLESNPKSVTYWIGGGEEVMIISSSKHKVRLIDKGRYKMQMRLTIRNVGPEDFGSYKCIAKNSKGEAEGTLRLYEPESLEPQFLDVLPNITVVAGSDVTLSCVVDSLGNYKVAWIYKNRHILISINDQIITRNPKFKITHDDFRNWSLEIRGISESDSGQYMCQVNTVPFRQIVGNIVVVETPIISTPEELVGAEIATDVTLVCNLESNPKPVTYWSRDGDGFMIISNTKYNTRLIDTGTNKVQMILLIKDLSPEDFGSYSCIAKNSKGEAEGIIRLYEKPKTHSFTDSSIDISESNTKLKKPVISIPNKLVKAEIGANVRLKCNLESNPRSITYWTRGSELGIISNTKYKIKRLDRGLNKMQMRLIIRNLQPDDFGSYTCVAKNTKGEAKGTIRLYEMPKKDSSTYLSADNSGSSIEKKPPILSIPYKVLEVETGEDVTLICNLKSNPKSVTYWTRDDGNIMIIRNTKYSTELIDTGMNEVQMKLVIKNLHPDDFGPYRCIAKNSEGEAEGTIKLYESWQAPSSSYPLSVDSQASNVEKQTPLISVQKKVVEAEIGEDVTLLCNLKSNPKSVTYWTREDINIMIIRNKKYNTDLVDTGMNEIQMKLIIKNLNPDDFGSYRCIAKNSEGEAEGIIKLYESWQAPTSIYPVSVDSLASNVEKKTPVISVPNKVMEAEIGADVTLFCDLKPNPKSVTYWTREDESILIFRNTKYNIELIDTGINEVQMKLIIKNLHPDDFGLYRCIAKNSEGGAEGTIKLYESWQAHSSSYPLSVDSHARNVEKKTPVISLPNKVVEAEIGADVTLVCNLKSNPRSVTYWTREDANIMIIRDKKHSTDLIDTGMNEVQMKLIIKNLHPDDFGSYRCIAKNSEGEAEGIIKLYESWQAPSSSNSLSVDSQASGIEKKTPVISIPNKLVRAAIGENAALVCNLKSNPKSVTYWTGVGNEIMIIPDTKYNPILFDFGIDKVQMMLIIKNVGPEDFGSYTCVAKNAKGETEGTIRLEMPETQFTTYSSVHSLAKSTEKKSPIITVPNNLVGAAIGETATLYCNVESNPRSVNYWTRKGEGTLITSSNKYHVSLIDMGVNKAQMRLTINNLRLDEFGSYRCIAKNSKGEGDGTISLYKIRKADSPTFIIS